MEMTPSGDPGDLLPIRIDAPCVGIGVIRGAADSFVGGRPYGGGDIEKVLPEHLLKSTLTFGDSG
jgi:hypothetical protein